MGVELRPLGVRCNIQCQYCYQNPQRDAGNLTPAYDLDLMKAAIKAEGGPFALFGGEPLLVPERDLEELWSWGFQQFGQNTIQTNGTLINDEHVRMFRTYKVGVGISIDGPGDLNDVRWEGTLEKTRAATARTEGAIERLCQEGLKPSLIVTLHRANASAEKLPRLHQWFRDLDEKGVHSARLHLLEAEDDDIRTRYALSAEENIAALTSFADLQDELQRLKFDVFADMRQMLLGQDTGVACVWNGVRPVHNPGRSRGRGPGPAQQLWTHEQGWHRFCQGGQTGLRKVPGTSCYSSGARGLPRLPLLLDVQGSVPRDGDRWGLAQPYRALRCLENAICRAWRPILSPRASRRSRCASNDRISKRPISNGGLRAVTPICPSG